MWNDVEALWVQVHLNHWQLVRITLTISLQSTGFKPPTLLSYTYTTKMCAAFPEKTKAFCWRLMFRLCQKKYCVPLMKASMGQCRVTARNHPPSSLYFNHTCCTEKHRGRWLFSPKAFWVREKCLLACLLCLYQRTVQMQIRRSRRRAQREAVTASGTVQSSPSCTTSATERRRSHQCLGKAEVVLLLLCNSITDLQS